jgi:hypothetical protein
MGAGSLKKVPHQADGFLTRQTWGLYLDGIECILRVPMSFARASFSFWYWGFAQA